MARSVKYQVTNLAVPSTAADEVTVEALGGGRYAVTLDGKRSELESLVLPHGAVSMIIDGQSFNVEFDEKKDVVGVLLRGQLTRFDVADERKVRMRAAAVGFEVEGRQVVTAPMPGKIVKVFVKVGDVVTKDQALVAIEAMKMENELKSPRDGTVTELSTTEGASVEHGAVLLVVE